MKSYTVTGVAAAFPAGLVLALDADQVARRAHAVRVFEPEALGLAKAEQKAAEAELRRTGRVAVRVLREVEFKRGETVGVIAGGIAKALVQAIAPADAPAAQAARAAVAERQRRGAEINAQHARFAAEAERDRGMRKATGASLRPAQRRPAPAPAGLAAADTAALHKAGESSTGPQGVVVPNPPEQLAMSPSDAD